MRTDQPDAGFVPQSSDPQCKVLQVRGVKKLTIVIQQELVEDVVFYIAPEPWVFTPLSGSTIGGVSFIVVVWRGVSDTRAPMSGSADTMWFL